MLFQPTLTFTRQLVESALSEGEIAIDATVGNGHDTLFLAEQVGPAGRVYGFDIQSAALEVSRDRLRDADLLQRVRLIQGDHAQMLDLLAGQAILGTVNAIMFNLGYLPGSDRSIITRPESTLPALEASLALLVPGGLITVVLYPGHVGGERESEAVVNWAAGLPHGEVQVLRYQFLNPRRPAPWLLAIEKRGQPGI